MRPLKISAAKSGRRARTLEPVTQNLLHEATGVTWLPMGKPEDESAQPPAGKKSEAKAVEKQVTDAPKQNEGGSAPEQASLF